MEWHEMRSVLNYSKRGCYESCCRFRPSSHSPVLRIMKFWFGSGSADPCLWLMYHIRILLFSSLTFKTPRKTNIFGSGSISLRYGSGSFCHQATLVKKPWFLIFCDFFDFLSFKNYVKVPSKSIKQNNFLYICFLLASWRSRMKIAGRIRSRIRIWSCFRENWANNFGHSTEGLNTLNQHIQPGVIAGLPHQPLYLYKLKRYLHWDQ
jgi:hypothetical protein